MSDGSAVKFEAIETSQAQAGRMGLSIAPVNTSQLSDKALDQALAMIKEVASRIDQALKQAQGPKEIDVTLSLTVSAGGDIWIANTSVEGAISVTMSWTP